jgi:hypothetical protein
MGKNQIFLLFEDVMNGNRFGCIGNGCAGVASL